MNGSTPALAAGGLRLSFFDYLERGSFVGLDMYLQASFYISGYPGGQSKDPNYESLVSLLGVRPCASASYFHVFVPVGYWRKANAIHRWFENNVGGEEAATCNDCYVSKVQLQELHDLCKEVLENAGSEPGMVNDGVTFAPGRPAILHFRPGEIVARPDIAAELLPTGGGFFFGSTDYDEYYLESLRKTIKIIEGIFADPALASCDFYYRASW